MKITVQDVFERAKELVKKGHKFDHDFCPWCAIATAKTQLDLEYDVGIPVFELIRQFLTSVTEELSEDGPLVEARNALRPFLNVDFNSLTQDKCLEMLQEAEKSLERTDEEKQKIN